MALLGKEHQIPQLHPAGIGRDPAQNPLKSKPHSATGMAKALTSGPNISTPNTDPSETHSTLAMFRAQLFWEDTMHWEPMWSWQCPMLTAGVVPPFLTPAPSSPEQSGLGHEEGVPKGRDVSLRYTAPVHLTGDTQAGWQSMGPAARRAPSHPSGPSSEGNGRNPCPLTQTGGPRC